MLSVFKDFLKADNEANCVPVGKTFHAVITLLARKDDWLRLDIWEFLTVIYVFVVPDIL